MPNRVFSSSSVFLVCSCFVRALTVVAEILLVIQFGRGGCFFMMVTPIAIGDTNLFPMLCYLNPHPLKARA